MRIHIRIGADGFRENEAAEGLPHLLGYLQERPWLLEPKAFWDREANRIVVEIKIEGNNPRRLAESVIDEVWDCVIAAIHFSSEGVHFELMEVAADE